MTIAPRGAIFILNTLMTLNRDQINQLGEKLIAEKTDIEEQIKKLEKDVDFGDETDHLEEEADETEEIINRLGVKTVLKNRLSEIEAALQKIKEGGYGICENCGKEIDFEVLDTVPESKFCRDCKKI